MENSPQVLHTPQAQKNSTLPIIYFTTETLDLDSGSWFSTSKAVREAMEEFGCFIAVYDKVDSELTNEVLASLKEFFDLPMETKLLNANPDNPGGGSYLAPMPQIPDRESVTIEDSTTVEAFQRFAKVNWPSGNDHFCETIHSYSRQVSEVDKIVTKMIFESYGVGKYGASHIESTCYVFRANSYRAHERKMETDLGTNPHTDSSFLSFVKEDSVQGLQVQLKDGTWIPVDFPPSSFAVIAGDAMLAWSNGRIQACFHRVVTNGKARFSTVLFSFNKGVVQVPKELADDTYPLRFKAFDHFGLLNFRLKNVVLSSEERVEAYCGIKGTV